MEGRVLYLSMLLIKQKYLNLGSIALSPGISDDPILPQATQLVTKPAQSPDLDCGYTRPNPLHLARKISYLHVLWVTEKGPQKQEDLCGTQLHGDAFCKPSPVLSIWLLTSCEQKKKDVDLASFQRVNVVIRKSRKTLGDKDILLHWAPAQKPCIEEEEVCGRDSTLQNVTARSGLSHGNQDALYGKSERFHCFIGKNLTTGIVKLKELTVVVHTLL
ncbi:hypothetical protein HGM15179_010272 [Zosterops borbonicus]|uniref:Uncharacterized protein n=1 Tax=Zosterops borbonicus TaxID=364589 RepID=A0A8K1GDR1_9PASS|nr:hypothetical protein HGM15179_010272 [Zosterops borbonicus]